MGEDEIDYTAYWAAALARHKALIAAGCIPMVGGKRAGKGEEPEQEEHDDVSDVDG